MKLGKQQTCGFTDRTHRICRVCTLPGIEFLLGGRELEIVEIPKATIEELWCGIAGPISRQAKYGHKRRHQNSEEFERTPPYSMSVDGVYYPSGSKHVFVQALPSRTNGTFGVRCSFFDVRRVYPIQLVKVLSKIRRIPDQKAYHQ